MTATTGHRSAPPASAAPAARRHAAAGALDLVERDDELRAVDAALARVAAGDGGVVLFEGPAGIGKTRLLDELRRRAEDQGLAGARGPRRPARARVRASASSASCLSRSPRPN